MAEKQDDTASIGEHLFFSKQPIFSRNPKVWGYELIYRDSPWLLSATTNGVPPGRAASLAKRMAANAYALNLRGRVGAAKLMVPFSEASLLEKAPAGLPASHTVIELRESPDVGEDVLAVVDALRDDGYLLALDDFEGLPGCEALLQRADILRIDVREKRPVRILESMNKVEAGKALLVAKGVDTIELHKLARALGFKLFQGAYYKKAEVRPDRSLTASEASRLELFKVISGKPDFPKLAQSIAMDASISYRLLVFLNSAYFSFPVEITSIQHAVVLLGWEQIKNWLRVAILTDLSPSEKSHELVRIAAQRARFFELAASRSGYPADFQDSLFLLGLFSLLDAMLDMPMAEVVQALPINDDIKAGLLREKNVFAVWLELAKAIEETHWERVDKVVKLLRMESAVIASAYYDSHVLTNSFFEMSQ
ncbi:MAG: HDOD domain-containing protein [Desulfovibrio sp.]|nr:HDOD domain-containing protein [Desulfovibrio sp.]MCA1985545.1 HDOD domain-containing protein [Desulfovibrio sp.]